MPQDRESGAKASQYGRDCGKKIMEAIGAKSVKAGSNECSLGSDLLSVHCARRHTDRVGVTYKALGGIAAVLGAFEQEDGSYIIWRLSKHQFEERMIGTRALGHQKVESGWSRELSSSAMAFESPQFQYHSDSFQDLSAI